MSKQTGGRTHKFRAAIWILAAAFVLALAPAAHAGGNWIESERFNVVRSTVSASAIFFTRSEQKVRAAGPYFAYLGPVDRGWNLPDPQDPRTIQLGRLDVIWPGPDSKLKGMMRFNPRARITFDVPDIKPGAYLIAFCNRDCTRPLGDVDASGTFRVVSSPLEARLRERLADRRLRFVTFRQGTLRTQGRQLRALERELDDATDLNESLRSQLQAARRLPPRGESSSPWPYVLGAVAVSGAWLLGRRRRGSGRPATVAAPERFELQPEEPPGDLKSADDLDLVGAGRDQR